MKFLKRDVAMDWCNQNSIALDEAGLPEIQTSEFTTEYFRTPPIAARLFWFSQVIEKTLRPWTRSLMWVSGWRIWESSENWHLYYRFRQTYFDQNLLEDAPAHLMLRHEVSDLVSLIHLSLNFGWDVYLLTSEDRSRVFISHDGWIAFSYKDAKELDVLRQELVGSGVETHCKFAP